MNQNENQWDRFLKIREKYCCFLLSIGGIYQLSDDGGTANVL